MQRISAEKAGISSAAVEGFMRQLCNQGIPMHSVLLARSGRLCFEWYAPPYHEGMPHRMYSITKSLTALAIGLLQDEGKLTLSDTVVSHFPDYAGLMDDLGTAMTLRDMLTMCTIHRKTAYKIHPSQDWVRSFFEVPSDRPGGMGFAYDTSSSHVLAALAERLSGMDLLSYLRQKCLDAIGFSKGTYILQGPDGVSMGGSGLMALPMDILRLMLLVAAGGRHNGEQLLPEDFLREAISWQVDTCGYPGANFPGLWNGYGYQIWRTSHDGYFFYGMGGQFAICLPKAELVLVTTADTQSIPGGTQAIFDALWQHLYPVLQPLAEENPQARKSLTCYARQCRLPHVQGRTDSPLASRLHGIPFRMDPSPFGLESVTLSFHKPDEGELCYQWKGTACRLPFGLGKQVLSTFPLTNLRCASSAAWRDEHQLRLWVQIIDEYIGSLQFSFCFRDETLCLLMQSYIENNDLALYQGYSIGHITP